MRPETVIYLVTFLLFLTAFNISFDLGIGSSSHYETVEVVDVKQVSTYGGIFYSRRGKTNVVKVRLQNGKTIPINIKNNRLPEMGSFIEVEVRKGMFFGNSYKMVER